MPHLPDDEDASLMCRAREGDVGAFACLATRHRRRVESFLYRLFWDRGKAEDGAQEVFLRLWMARRRYEVRARFTTFLYQVARNYWLDELRKARVRPEVEWPQGEAAVHHFAAPEAEEPYHQLLARYRQWRIRQAIARLPEIHRVVFVLGHLEERPLAEIAEILEIPLGTVKSRMHAAVRMLRAWLIEEEER